MSGLDICVAEITKKFRDQAKLRNFIFDYVWKKNNHCVLGSRRVINQEHFYTLDELILVLSINHQGQLRFKQRVASSEVEIKIHQYVYYSLPKLIVGNAFITEAVPMTYINLYLYQNL